MQTKLYTEIKTHAYTPPSAFARCLKLPLVLALAAGTLFAASVQADVILFHDNFSLPGTGNEFDLNVDIATRQAGGTTTSTYTKDAASSYINRDTNVLTRYGTTKVRLDTDFGSAMGANDFTFSFDMQLTSTTTNWTNINLSHAGSEFGGPLSLFFYGDGTNIISMRTGTEGAHTGLGWTQAMLDTAVGGTFDVNAMNSYSLVGTVTGTNTASVDFLINDQTLFTNQAITFSGSSRFITTANNAAGANYDNLQLSIIPEPATAALVLGFLALGFVIRRRR